MTTTILQDLFDHGDWANQKLLDASHGLSPVELDEPREIGFGTLRNTFFHILEAERLWLERWQGKPWRPLITQANGMQLDEIRQGLTETATARNELLALESADNGRRTVEFKDSSARPWAFDLADLMLHVVNHGIHHRAQVLNFLRGFERRVPAGVDYIFWKLARPSCALPEGSLESLRNYGLEVASGPGNAPQLDRQRLQTYFDYADWATRRVFESAAELDSSQLDQEFSMGMGTLRRNLQHVIDAERWWLANWEKDHSAFPRGEAPRAFDAMRAQFEEVARRRRAYVASLDDEEAQRIVHVTAGGPSTCFRVVESLLQLCGHGTHHRAQVLNMLRRLNVQPPAIDLIVWLRDN